jgi:hypothetical protein
VARQREFRHLGQQMLEQLEGDAKENIGRRLRDTGDAFFS